MLVVEAKAALGTEAYLDERRLALAGLDVAKLDLVRTELLSLVAVQRAADELALAGKHFGLRAPAKPDLILSIATQVGETVLLEQLVVVALRESLLVRRLVVVVGVAYESMRFTQHIGVGLVSRRVAIQRFAFFRFLKKPSFSS